MPILKQWEQNKEPFYKLLQDSLAIKQPIIIPKSIQEENFKNYFMSKITNYKDLIEVIDSKTLLSNVLQDDLKIKDKIYPKNMKLTRVLKRVLPEKDFNVIDNLYERAVRNHTDKGDLYISIDPIDFLTMGNNQTGWTSCHSLSGEFKGGLLSLLTDEHTFVGYFNDNLIYDFHDVKVVNKKWRVLIHGSVRHSFFIFNTEYPFINDFLLKKLIHMLEDLMMDYYGLFPEKLYHHVVEPQFPVYEFMEDIYPEFEDPLHHNDLLINDGAGFNSGIHVLTTEETFNKVFKEHKPDFVLYIGNIPICPVCGDSKVDHHKSLECDSCDPIEYCCTCGEGYHEEELHCIDHELYCDGCYDDEFEYCEFCDESVRRVEIELGEHECEAE